jgi:hypothetical protein
MAASCEDYNEPSDFIKAGEFLDSVCVLLTYSVRTRLHGVTLLVVGRPALTYGIGQSFSLHKLKRHLVCSELYFNSH